MATFVLRSQRTDEVHRGVCPRDLAKRAASVAPGMAFSHISVLSFLPLELPPGRSTHLPVGVIVPHAKTTQSMATAWPAAHIRANPSGSMTSSLFAELVSLCFIEPLRAESPDPSKELLLMMDGGGGTYLHISPHLSALCVRHKVRIFLIPPYGTKALCSLDQDCHKHFASQWSQFKASWASQYGQLNLRQALSAASKIAEEALSPQRAKASYHMIGIDAGKKINIDKVVLERADELFSSLRAQGANAVEPSSSRKRVFDLVSAVAPPKSKCLKCQKKNEVVDQFCRDCGEPNHAFDKELYDIHRAGKQSGWVANADWLSKQKAQNADEDMMMAKTGDFLKKIRRAPAIADRLAAPATPAAPGTPAAPATPAMPAAPASSSTAAALKVPSTPPAKQKVAEVASAVKTSIPASEAEVPQKLPEFDCDLPTDCVKLICRHFAVQPPDLAAVAAFYVDHLRAKTNKTHTLSSIFQKEVLKSGLLKKKESRKMWYDSWKSNRGQRFVQLPDYLQ
eukprot:Skav218528  [mRNA]  locus=scaffold2478:307127:308656:- [translate_table: standard]